MGSSDERRSETVELAAARCPECGGTEYVGCGMAWHDKLAPPIDPPTHRLVGADIKFRTARCCVCKHIKQVRFFPWNARSEVARGWVCFPCYIVLRDQT